MSKYSVKFQKVRVIVLSNLQGIPAMPLLGKTMLVLSFRHHSEKCFLLRILFKMKVFVLIDNILSETICIFCFCVLFSNIYPKIRYTVKNQSDLCKFYSKVIFFFKFLSKKVFLTFLSWIWIIDVSHINIVKISEKINKQNLLKTCLQLPALQISALFAFTFTMGKSENIQFFENQWLE